MYESTYTNCPLCGQAYETKKAKRITEKHLADGIIKLYAERQQQEHLPCPMCGQDNMDENVSRNAKSRIAPVQICNECGMREAIFAFEVREHSVLDWWLIDTCFPCE